MAGDADRRERTVKRTIIAALLPAAGTIIGSAILAVTAYFSATSILIDEHRSEEAVAAYADYLTAYTGYLFSDPGSAKENETRIEWYQAEARVAVHGSDAVITGASLGWRLWLQLP